MVYESGWSFIAGAYARKWSKTEHKMGLNGPKRLVCQFQAAN